MFKKIKSMFAKSNVDYVDGELNKLVSNIRKKHVGQYDKELQILNNLKASRHRNVESVMTPRIDIIGCDVKEKQSKVVDLMITNGLSRILIYNNGIDSILGFVHIKDINAQITGQQFNLEDLIRKVVFINPFSNILDALTYMRNRKIHIGVVSDEFGGVAGVVTIEDLLEEIVGEIEDEYDSFSNDSFKSLGENAFEINTRITLAELSNILQHPMAVPDQPNIKTLGGLLNHLAGSIPQMGEKVVHENSGVVFEIIKASKSSTKLVIAHVPYNN